MRVEEFRRQIFRGSCWAHGLSYKLEQLESGGVALFSRSTFKDWAIQSDNASYVANLAIDDCGRIFWIHQCDLYRYDPINQLSESIISLGDCSHNQEHWFGRMLSVKRRLWILDRGGSRLIGLRTDTFQIIAEVHLTEPIDVTWAKDRFFVVDRNGISAYDIYGNLLAPPRREHLAYPVAIGADPNAGFIYVVDNAAIGFLRFKPDGTFDQQIGDFTEVAANFKPHLLAIHAKGNLFVSDGSPFVHEFSPDGGYIGKTGDLSPFTEIFAIAFSPTGDLYIGSPQGIARLTFTTGLAGGEGVFYSGALDSGSEGSDCWHRVDLVTDLEAGGTVEVSYATSDNPGLVSAVENVIKQSTPAKDRSNTLETLLDWKEPDVLRAFSPDEAAEEAVAHSGFRQRLTHSSQFREEANRYIWLKLTLSGLASGAKAAVHEMRVYYPRLSYLRYLPAVYQEDPTSHEFLQRFLAIFETVASGLESTIERIPELFDPERTPKEFLDWLAQWLDLGVEEDWSADVKRRLIRNAVSLYQKKGRPDGIVQFIEIVTGKQPIIRESFESERPLILGDSHRLGRDTRIFRRPMKDLPSDQRTVLGVGSRLGTTRIRSTRQIPINPFSAAANHFTLLLDLSPQEFRRHERGLHRIIRENSPAHVAYDIRLLSGAGLGPNMVLGVNFRVEDPQPFYVGHSSLGRSILRGFSYGPQLGIDAMLAGRECGPESSSDVCYGEQ